MNNSQIQLDTQETQEEGSLQLPNLLENIVRSKLEFTELMLKIYDSIIWGKIIKVGLKWWERSKLGIQICKVPMRSWRRGRYHHVQLGQYCQVGKTSPHYLLATATPSWSPHPLLQTNKTVENVQTLAEWAIPRSSPYRSHYSVVQSFPSLKLMRTLVILLWPEIPPVAWPLNGTTLVPQ